MINIIGALTLTMKLGISIAVFAVFIIVEILALVMLVKWKKNYKKTSVKNSAGDEQSVASAIAQDNAADNVQDGQLAENQQLQTDNAENSQPEEVADGVAGENNESTQEEQDKPSQTNDNKWSAFAIAPFMLMSVSSSVTPLRYVLYALIGVSVALGIVVFATAIILSKSLTKSKAEEPVKDVVEEEQPQEQPAEEMPESVEEHTEEVQEQIAAEEVTAEETQEIVEEEQPVEDEAVEETVEEPIVEEEPAVEDSVVEENLPAEEPVAVEEPVKTEPKPAKVKRPPVPREQTMVLDDVALVIKDDRFLFNPSDDGYYYILEKTFTAKLIQSDEYVKDYYTELKNELLSYKKVHARMSKKRESFNFGRVCLVRMTIRGKTLRLHFALDAKDYEESKYKVEDTSNIKSLADTALMYRIKNDRRLKYAKDLIAAVMEKYGVQKQEIEPVDYTSMYPYEETPPLIERGLIIRRRAKGKVPEGNGFDFAQKTFKAKLIQAEDTVKEYYSHLKNALLSYRKVHDRMSKKRESYRFGRTCVARMSIRGKTLRLYLALDANDYIDTKYKVEDVSDVKSVADTPLLMKIKNPRRLKYAIELIDAAMTKVGTTKKRESDETDYVADLPFESLEELMEKGLVKNVHVEGNSFVAQHFTFKPKDEEDAEDEVAADEE